MITIATIPRRTAHSAASRRGSKQGGIICEFSLFSGCELQGRLLLALRRVLLCAGRLPDRDKGRAGNRQIRLHAQDRARGRGARAGRGIRFMLRRSGLSRRGVHTRAAPRLGRWDRAACHRAEALRHRWRLCKPRQLLPLWSDRRASQLCKPAI